MYMQCISQGAFLFFLGHGDSTDKNVPTLVRDITGVGQVACGSSHTIAVSQDGRTVWSFGGGDNGEIFVKTQILSRTSLFTTIRAWMQCLLVEYNF